MMRETSSPDLVSSKLRTGSRMTCCCTWERSRAMSRCASTLSSRVRRKEVTACTETATATAPSRTQRSRGSPPVITSSTRYLVEAGSTNPLSRLTRMRPRPAKTSLRCGQMISRKARRMLVVVGFGLSVMVAQPTPEEEPPGGSPPAWRPGYGSQA
jgi:hypothetical protein